MFENKPRLELCNNHADHLDVNLLTRFAATCPSQSAEGFTIR